MTDEAIRSHPSAVMSEFHDQDWLIVIEALAAWAGNPNKLDLHTNPRKSRSWNLMSTIASECSVPESPPLKQVDDTWGGPEESQ